MIEGPYEHKQSGSEQVDSTHTLPSHALQKPKRQRWRSDAIDW